MAVTKDVKIRLKVEREGGGEFSKIAGESAPVQKALDQMVQLLQDLNANLKTFATIHLAAMMQATKATQTLTAANNAATASYTGVNKQALMMAQSFGTANANVAQSAESFDALTGSMQPFSAAAQNVMGFVESFNQMAAAIDNATDPRKMQALSNLLMIASMLAMSKGKFGLAEQLRGISDKAQEAANGMAKLDAVGEQQLQDMADKGRTLTGVIDTTQTAMTGLIGAYGLFKASQFAQRFDFVREATEKFRGSIGKTGAEVGTFTKTVMAGATPSFMKFIEGATLVAPLLYGIGTALRDSESAFVRFLGIMVQVASFMLGGFAVAINAVIFWIADLAVSIGVKLMTAMEGFTEVAQKAEQSLAAFTFTVVNFGKELGEGSVGSIELWNEQVAMMAETTAFSQQSIQKSIKLLIADGMALGITVEQNTQLLKRAGDIAAATGKDLEEVTIALLSGISGNSQAALALGIDLRESAMAHSELVKESGKAIEQMSNMELQQARLGMIFERTKPLIGAAAMQLETVAGASEKLANTTKQLKAELGAQGVVTRTLIVLQQKFIQSLLDLPKSVTYAMGTLQDFASVTLIVGGTVLKYVFAVSLLVGILTTLTKVVQTNAFAQMLLNSAMAMLPATVSTNVVAITGLASVYTNLLVIVRALTAALWQGLVGALSKMGSMLVSAAAYVLPIVARLAGLIGLVLAIGIAFKELVQETKFLNDGFIAMKEAIVDAFSGTSIFSTALAAISNGIKGTLVWLKDLVKLLLGGFMMSVLVTARVIYTLRKAFADNGNQAEEMQQQIDTLDKHMAQLGKTTRDTLANVVDPFAATAVAAENAANSVQKVVDVVGDLNKSITTLNKANVDKMAISTSVLGDQFDRAVLAAEQANVAYNKAFESMATAEEHTKEQVEELAKLREEAGKAYFEVLRLQRDTVQDVANKQKAAMLDQLKAQGKLVQVARLEAAARMEEFNKQVSGMQKLGDLSKDQLATINKTRAALQAQAKAQIAAAQLEETKAAAEAAKKASEDITRAQEMALKKFEDMKKVSGDLQLELQKRGKNALEVADIEYQLALQSVDLLTDELSLNGKLNAEAMRIINNYKDLLKAKKEAAKQDLGVMDTPISGLVESLMSNMDAVYDSISSGLSKAFEGGPSAALGRLGAAAGSMMDTIKKMSLADWGKGLWSVIKSGAKAIGDYLKDITLQDIVNGIGAAFSGIKGIFSGDYLNQFASIVEDFGSFPAKLLEAFKNFGAMAAKLVSELPAVIQQLLQQIPKIAELLAKNIGKIVDIIVKSMPAIAEALAKAIPVLLQAVLDAMPKLIQMLPAMLKPLIEAIPGIITQIMDALPEIISSVFEALPQIFTDIFKAIPSIVENLMENMDRIVGAFVDGLISAMAMIAISFVDEFLLNGGIERIVGAYFRAIPRIVAAIVHGIVSGLSKAFSTIFGGFELPESITKLPENIANGAKKLGKDIARETSQIFAVKDLMDAARGVDTAEKISKAINDATTLAGQKIQGWWNKLLEAWQAIYNKYLKPFVDSISNTFSLILEKLNLILSGIATALAFVLDGISSLIQKLGTIGGTIWEGFRTAMESGAGVFEQFGASIYKGLKTALADLGPFLTKMFDDLDPKNLFKRIFKVPDSALEKGDVEKILGIDIPFLKFAQGGVVPGSAPVGGDSLLNDRILALLSPGEAVIPRSMMADPGIAAVVDSIVNGTLRVPRFYIGEGAVNSATDTAGDIYEGAKGAAEGAASAVSGAISSAAAAAKGAVTAGGKTLADTARETLKALGISPDFVWQKVRDKVMNEMLWAMFEQNKFAMGGAVGGSGAGDTVPALLTPGEFVVNRKATQNNMGLLNSLNSGLNASNKGSSGVNIESITINAKTLLDADQIRREVIPAIERDLLRKSQNGQRILDPSGVRK